MPTEEIPKAIGDLSEKFMHAVNSRNINSITALYADKPRFMPAGGDIPRWGNVPDNRWTKDYISKYWNSVFQITEGGFKYVQYVRGLEVLGEIAHEIGIYDLRMSNTEGEIEAGTYFILWQKKNRQWEIAVHILNSTSRPKWGKTNDEN